MTYHATSCKEGGIRHYFPYFAPIPSKTKKSRIHSASILSLSLFNALLSFPLSLLPTLVLLHHPQPPAAAITQSVGSRLLPYKWLLLLPTMHQPTNHAPPPQVNRLPRRADGSLVRPSALRANFTCIIFLFDSDFQPPSECLPACAMLSGALSRSK